MSVSFSVCVCVCHEGGEPQLLRVSLLSFAQYSILVREASHSASLLNRHHLPDAHKKKKPTGREAQQSNAFRRPSLPLPAYCTHVTRSVRTGKGLLSHMVDEAPPPS
jgi:hypothetical protein